MEFFTDWNDMPKYFRILLKENIEELNDQRKS